MHYYQFHIGDYRSSTMHLSNEEDLAYRRLIDWYYDTEKPIPLETQWVSRRLRVGCEALESVLNDFFLRTEDGWVSPRCEQEIAEYRKLQDRNKANGAKGGRPRNGKTGLEPNKNNPEKPSGFPVATQSQPTETQTEPTGKATINHKPRTINQEPETINHVATADAVAPARRRSSTSSAKNHSATSATWTAYESAFLDRYGTEPVRNAKVNGMLANLVKRIGEEDAPHVARYYVGHNDSFYVRRMHSVDMLLNSCESLHAQWKTGREITHRKAQEVERMGFEFVSNHDDKEIF